MRKLLSFIVLSVLLSNVVQCTTDFLQYLNTSVDPCYDFYEHTCGNFKNVYPLPDGALTVDQFKILEHKTIEITNKILKSSEEQEDPEALKKAKSIYQSCVDVTYLDKRAVPELVIVDHENGYPMVEPRSYGITTSYNWNDIADDVSEYGVPMLFTIMSYSNPFDSTTNLIYMSTDYLLNPTFLRYNDEFSYELLIEKGLIEMAGRSSVLSENDLAPFDVFLRRMAFKLQRAMRHHVDKEEIIYNIAEMAKFMRGVYNGGYIPENVTVSEIGENVTVTLKQLNEWTTKEFGDTAEIDWVEFMKRIFKNSGIDIADSTEILNYKGLNKLIYGILNWVRSADKRVVKNFVMTRLFLYNAPDSDAETRDALVEYFTKLNVTILPRWEYCTRKVIDYVGTAGLSFAVAYEYQLHHFNVNGLSKALQMVRDLQDSFKELIKETTWMDNKSKELALLKLQNIITILGYPEFISNKTKLDKFYENFRVCKWDNYGNSKRMRAFKLAYQISQIEQRERAYWDKSPFEINAYYNRGNNKIIFPMGILNHIFFGSNSSILDYGRIGSIIGHEITHGFDKLGRMFDQEGISKSWWSKQTEKAFDEKAACFVKQYSKYYVPEIDSYVNANASLNENIADNGGVRESYRAMRKLLKRKRHGKYLGYTPEQLFFIGFGTMWCNNPSISYLEAMKDKEHAPSKWRVNGVLSNLEEFATAFNCPLGSNMNPIDKCRLW